MSQIVISQYHVGDKFNFKLPVHRQILGEPAVAIKVYKIGTTVRVDLTTPGGNTLCWTASQVTCYCTRI